MNGLWRGGRPEVKAGGSLTARAAQYVFAPSD
jgi:hypothetical protein